MKHPYFNELKETLSSNIFNEDLHKFDFSIAPSIESYGPTPLPEAHMKHFIALLHKNEASLKPQLTYMEN